MSGGDCTMESSRQTTTKIASPDATIISDSPYLLIGQQLRGHLNSLAFLGDPCGAAWPGATEFPHPCVKNAVGMVGQAILPAAAFSGGSFGRDGTSARWTDAG